jgi:hypothetical protein
VTSSAAGTAGAQVTPEEPAADLGEAAEEVAEDVTEAVAAPEAVALSGERGKFYLGVGGFYEANYTNPDDGVNNGGGVFGFLDDVRVRPRVKVGVDDIVAGFGLRAAADYGRQSLIDSGSLATTGHLTYSFGVPAVGAYLGLGGGYQFSDLIFDSDVAEGPFAGALLGAEFGGGPLTFFVEGTADYYFNDTGVEGYQQLYPTVAAGFNLRP